MIYAIRKTWMELRIPVIKLNLQFNAEFHRICQSLAEFIKRSLHLNQNRDMD